MPHPKSKETSLLAPYRFLLLCSLFLGLSTPAVFGYFTLFGWPEPMYITHGPLAFTPLSTVLTNEIIVLMGVLVVTLLQTVYLFVRRRAWDTLLVGLQILALQFFLLVLSLGLLFLASV